MQGASKWTSPSPTKENTPTLIMKPKLCSSQVWLTQTYKRKADKVLDQMDAQLGTKRKQNQMFIWSVFIKEGEDWASISDNNCRCDQCVIESNACRPLTVARCFSS